jgi:hypothetical protein
MIATGAHIQHTIKLVAALIQTGVFADFCYYYFKR